MDGDAERRKRISRVPDADWDLMLRVRNDDESAFAELMRRYNGRLTSFFLGLCRDRSLADDLVQETFLRLWRSRSRCVPMAKFSTFLMTIARNLWLSEKPRWRRRIAVQSLYSLEGEPSSQPDATRVAREEERRTPEARILARETTRRIVATLETLSPEIALAFILSHMEGMKIHDIATALSLPEGTVKWRIHEAKRRLRERLPDLLEE